VLFALLSITAPAHAALIQIGGWGENILPYFIKMEPTVNFNG
jgi:hypothetical protein